MALTVVKAGGCKIELTRISTQGIYFHPNTVVLIAYQKWWRGFRPPAESKAGGFREFLIRQRVLVRIAQSERQTNKFAFRPPSQRRMGSFVLVYERRWE